MKLSVLQQLVARWKAKSPKLFVYITNISLVLAFITGIPELLYELGLAQIVVLPEVVNKVILYSSIISSVIAKITVATPLATEKVLTQIAQGTESEIAVQNK